MEGVGARLGRSSTRYGPTTVFSGPVRRWKKKWVPLCPPSTTTTAAAAASHPNGNGTTTAPNLVLYKWTPISNGGATAEATPEAPARRKFRYVPIYVTEEQKHESAAKSDDESKPTDGDPLQQPAQTDGSEVKPDMNDVTMEEPQASEKDQAPADEVNETNLDLSLGLKGHGGDAGSDPKTETVQGESSGPGEDAEMRPATNTEAPDLEMRV